MWVVRGAVARPQYRNRKRSGEVHNLSSNGWPPSLTRSLSPTWVTAGRDPGPRSPQLDKGRPHPHPGPAGIYRRVRAPHGPPPRRHDGIPIYNGRIKEVTPVNRCDWRAGTLPASTRRPLCTTSLAPPFHPAPMSGQQGGPLVDFYHLQRGSRFFLRPNVFVHTLFTLIRTQCAVSRLRKNSPL